MKVNVLSGLRVASTLLPVRPVAVRMMVPFCSLPFLSFTVAPSTVLPPTTLRHIAGDVEGLDPLGVEGEVACDSVLGEVP